MLLKFKGLPIRDPGEEAWMTELPIMQQLRSERRKNAFQVGICSMFTAADAYLLIDFQLAWQGSWQVRVAMLGLHIFCLTVTAWLGWRAWGIMRSAGRMMERAREIYRADLTGRRN